MSLTKAEMADRLFDEVGLNKREAKEFVDAFFEAIRAALEGGENVKLSGFGTRGHARLLPTGFTRLRDMWRAFKPKEAPR